MTVQPSRFAIASRHETSELLAQARRVLHAEADAIRQVADRLDESLATACRMLEQARQVVVCGMGKAGWVGQKIAATLASTGTPAQFLHPAEAIHGDLGRVARGDVVIAFSNSGETEELVRLLPVLRDLGAKIVAVTASDQSTLGRYGDVVLQLGKIPEACSLGLAPSASTAAMMAVGDALALVVSQCKGFAPEDFARYHPGGSLGRRLARVEEAMRPLEQCRLALHTETLREVLVASQSCGASAAGTPIRRTGATMLVDESGRLTGIFTDSDLVRRISAGQPLPLDQPVSTIMTKTPKSVPKGCRLTVALEILANHKISELPVLDAGGRPLGLIDVTDVMDLGPAPAPRLYVEPEEGEAP